MCTFYWVYFVLHSRTRNANQNAMIRNWTQIPCSLNKMKCRRLARTVLDRKEPYMILWLVCYNIINKYVVIMIATLINTIEPLRTEDIPESRMVLIRKTFRSSNLHLQWLTRHEHHQWTPEHHSLHPTCMLGWSLSGHCSFGINHSQITSKGYWRKPWIEKIFYFIDNCHTNSIQLLNMHWFFVDVRVSFMWYLRNKWKQLVLVLGPPFRDRKFLETKEKHTNAKEGIL